jgi:hypothetical protein
MLWFFDVEKESLRLKVRYETVKCPHKRRS